MAFTAQRFAGKLRNLRESFGNSLTEVASATGIGTQALQALESGTATPTGDEVLILADYFKREFPWLIDDDAVDPDENMTLLLRSEGGRLAAADRHAIAEFLHLCKSQALLEELLEIRPAVAEFKFLVKGGYFKGQGIDCAQAFRKWHQLPVNGIVPDIFDWLRGAGLRVFRRPLPNSPISGLFVRHPEVGKCILINASEDLYRQRFSAAHEAGHALLDADKEFNVSSQADDGSIDRTEIRANSFASAFLMPPEILKMLGTQDQWLRPEKIVDAADRLSVTIPALLSALVRDKIIDEAARFNLRNMRLRLPEKREPELDGLTGRQLDRKKALLATGLHSKYVQQAFEAHRQGLISSAKLAEMLLVDPSEVVELASLFGTSLHHG
ncbi:MAG: XRE family transcriptional regulator [Magnetospirillum sp. WYHS-4]